MVWKLSFQPIFFCSYLGIQVDKTLGWCYLHYTKVRRFTLSGYGCQHLEQSYLFRAVGWELCRVYLTVDKNGKLGVNWKRGNFRGGNSRCHWILNHECINLEKEKEIEANGQMPLIPSFCETGDSLDYCRVHVGLRTTYQLGRRSATQVRYVGMLRRLGTLCPDIPRSAWSPIHQIKEQ